MLRSAFVSLFWGIITERKKSGTFTLQGLAKALGKNKGEVSRWFNGDPNWTVNTIAAIADTLNVDLNITAIDRVTGQVFTVSGPQKIAAPDVISWAAPTQHGNERPANPFIFNATRNVPRPDVTGSDFGAKAA
jgi:transcriptional regulator with XRE-family HTH domain